MYFWEICVFEDCSIRDTSLADSTKKNSKNVLVLIHIRPSKNVAYCKSNGKQKLQMHLSQNYDFVFTNLLKYEADLFSVQDKHRHDFSKKMNPAKNIEIYTPVLILIISITWACKTYSESTYVLTRFLHIVFTMRLLFMSFTDLIPT